MPRALFVSFIGEERTMFAAALGGAGFEMRVFAGPTQAFRDAVEWQPDVVIARILQPGSIVDGLELTRRIRLDTRTRNVAVVLMTSLSVSVLRAAAASAGADLLLSLPCAPGELIPEIRRVVARRSLRPARESGPGRIGA